MRDITVTLIQADLVWEDISANLSMFDQHLEGLDRSADLIVLPEMFSTGFTMNAPAMAQTMQGEGVEWLKQKARLLDTAIVGSLIISENGRYFNRLIWTQPDGTICTYDKRHLFRMLEEEKVYHPGDRALTVALHGWRVRPFVCYDLRFPLWARNWSDTYDLALFVANWPAARALHWRALLQARAIENQAYVVGVNRVGVDGNGIDFSGDSTVVDPQGEILFTRSNVVCSAAVTLSADVLRDYRRRFPAWKDADRHLLAPEAETILDLPPERR